MRKPISIVCSAAVGLAGCATSSQDISTSYVSPLQYQGYDCAQITAEVQRIQTRVVDLGGRLDQAAQNDKAIMGVGLILFWPALFALGGTKQQEAEYSRIKGEYDALQQASIAKKCSGVVASGGVLEPIPATAATSVASAEKQLELLRELKAKGILTEAEFDTKRTALAESVLTVQPSKNEQQSNGPKAGVGGLRITLRDTDPLTGVVSAENIMTIDSVSERGAVLNGGLTTLDPTGRVSTGAVPLPHLAGLGGGRLTPGSSASASFAPTSSVFPPVDLRVRVLRMETIRLSDRDVTVARCAVTGNSGRPQMPMGLSRPGSAISGEIAVEPITGLMLSAKIESSDVYYTLRRDVAPSRLR